MATLFDLLKIGNIELKNRVVMAPLTRSRANDDGVQKDFVKTYYSQRASAGLIISEATNVSAMAKGYVRTPGIYTAEQIAAWREITNAVHGKDGKIFMQLFHTGRIALPDFLPDNAQPVSASNVKADGKNYTDSGMKDFVEPRELSTDEVKQTVRDFAQAAENAIEAGFDGVEIHGANGYLIAQFLSDNTNKRTDEYGGSVENRARFLLEIADATIAKIGAERVSLKISPDNTFNDIHETDSKTLYAFVINELNSKKLAYLHVASMMPRDNSINWHEVLRPIYDGIYFAGAGFTQQSGEKLLMENGADAIVYGTSFLANPDLPERFARNAELNTPDQSTFYTPDEKGYTDYPTLKQSHNASA